METTCLEDLFELYSSAIPINVPAYEKIPLPNSAITINTATHKLLVEIQNSIYRNIGMLFPHISTYPPILKTNMNDIDFSFINDILIKKGYFPLLITNRKNYVLKDAYYIFYTKEDKKDFMKQQQNR